MNHKLINSPKAENPASPGFERFKAPPERACGFRGLLASGCGESKAGQLLLGRQTVEENFTSSASMFSGTRCTGPEDALAFLFNGGIFSAGVFDGLGGKMNGEAASRQAAAILITELMKHNFSSRRADNFKWMLEYAFIEAADRLDLHGDGRATTATAFIADIRTGEFATASCGDSSAYLVSKNKAGLLVGGFPGQGMGFEEYSLMRRIVETSLGSRTRKIDFREGVLSPGDSLLLATDGLTDNLEIALTGHPQARETLITDSSGSSDLLRIFSECKGNAEHILKSIIKRLGESVYDFTYDEARKAAHVRKEDDALSCVVYTRK